MVITKSEDVQRKVSVKYSKENSVFRRVSYYLSFEFVWEGGGWGWALITFFCL